jgi:hypothetical protein
MIRFLLVALAFTSAVAFADPIPKKSRQVQQVKDTKWEGMDSLGHRETYHFMSDGAMEYAMDSARSNIGSWKQDGKKVTWECNNKYAEYEGTIENGEIKMEAKNVTGLTWSVTLKPAKDTPAEKP